MTKELAIDILNSLLKGRDSLVKNKAVHNYTYKVECTADIFDAIEMAKEALEHESKR